jgi:hypothetical protein
VAGVKKEAIGHQPSAFSFGRRFAPAAEKLMADG